MEKIQVIMLGLYVLIFLFSMAYIPMYENKIGNPVNLIAIIIVSAMWPVYYLFQLVRVWERYKLRKKHKMF